MIPIIRGATKLKKTISTKLQTYSAIFDSIRLSDNAITQPIHLVPQFDAPSASVAGLQSAAFSLVIDRSGSMTGAPLEAARRAARTVVQNLRREDLFSQISPPHRAKPEKLFNTTQPPNRFATDYTDRTDTKPLNQFHRRG